MFFAPPKVKSLSRYAEFGLYLGHRDFVIALAVAMVLHFSIIAVYMMIPREEVMRIPVRALNIKLTGGGNGHPVTMLSPATAPAVAAKTPVVADAGKSPAKKTDHGHGKATATEAPVVKSGSHPVVVDNNLKRPSRAARNEESRKEAAAEANLSTPKRYVRQNEVTPVDGGKTSSSPAAAAPVGTGLGAGAGTGGGSSAGDAHGQEIISRYEQTISLWISQHKIYPETAKLQSIEGDAIVRIRISRDGTILYHSLDKSSGNALIDAAVTSMVLASNPVPAVPSDYPEGTQLEFLIPVSFRLQ